MIGERVEKKEKEKKAIKTLNFDMSYEFYQLIQTVN